LVLAFLASPRIASAQPSFPGDIQCDLELNVTPRCDLCHSSVSGGPSPVSTKFGIAMKHGGLMYGSDGSVATALAQMEADKVDSVGDGTTDIQRLRDSLDPSTGMALDAIHSTTCSALTVPDFGCLARLAPSPSSASSIAVLAALSALFVARARRRARRRLALLSGLRRATRSVHAPAAHSSGAKGPRTPRSR
jgi:hypothetical protein